MKDESTNIEKAAEEIRAVLTKYNVRLNPIIQIVELVDEVVESTGDDTVPVQPKEDTNAEKD